MSWKLWLDDDCRNFDTPLRHPPLGYVGCASTSEAAIAIASLGLPMVADLDHDLGKDDSGMSFLHWLSSNYPAAALVTHFEVHSMNPIGKTNMISYINSWKNAMVDNHIVP